jgi:hypothetical protein
MTKGRRDLAALAPGPHAQTSSDMASGALPAGRLALTPGSALPAGRFEHLLVLLLAHAFAALLDEGSHAGWPT